MLDDDEKGLPHDQNIQTKKEPSLILNSSSLSLISIPSLSVSTVKSTSDMDPVNSLQSYS